MFEYDKIGSSAERGYFQKIKKNIALKEVNLLPHLKCSDKILIKV